VQAAAIEFESVFMTSELLAVVEKNLGADHGWRRLNLTFCEAHPKSATTITTPALTGSSRFICCLLFEASFSKIRRVVDAFPIQSVFERLSAFLLS
jgi:hypothetical protein